MSHRPDTNGSLHRRRQFLKSLAAAAGIAAITTETAFGSSLLLRSAKDDTPPQKKETCTTSYTLTSSKTWVVPATETKTMDLPPGPPGTMTRTYTAAPTYTLSSSETYTVDSPPGSTISLTSSKKGESDPNKSFSVVVTISHDGQGYSYTANRPWAHTVSQTLTQTVSGAYPCGDQALGLDQSAELKRAADRVLANRVETVDSLEDLFEVTSRRGGVHHLNF